MKNWTIYLIHHSHTDIGYTERQEKLMNYHRDFILQVIKILDDLHSGKLPGCEGFKWQCENQWQIENFYANATKEQTKKFEYYVKTGEIGLSGNYLNMTELVDREVLFSRTGKAKSYGERIGVPVKSGMSADINGYAWGYPDILSECGVENLLCALHPHHGMFPLYRKQQPFYWQGPKKNKILVWGGEHYHMGNEMFLCPHGGSSYMLFDDIREELAGGIHTLREEETEEKELAIAQTRILRYSANLEQEGYAYDFFPLMVSGAITDNAPPNAYVAKRVNDLNKLFEGKITIKMVTLDEFFEKVRSSKEIIPAYEGDFTDWWADGVGSTANTVKICREAQRKYDLCKKLDPENKLGDAKLLENAAENIMLYAEHTWGYSSSVSEPWDSLVACLEKKKDAYAINANTDVSRNLDLILSGLGEVSIDADKQQRYKAINPHPFRYRGTVKLYIEYWEYLEGNTLNTRAVPEAYDEKTGEKLICQGHRTARAYEVEVMVDLAPKEEKIIKLKQNFENTGTIKNHAHIGSEGIGDLETGKEYLETPFLIETDYFKVEFSKEKGIASILNKETGQFITDNTLAEGAFSGIYELTPIKDNNPCEVRRQMGRNRCSIATQRSVAKLTDIVIIESGEVFVTARLSYELPGIRYYSVLLKIYKGFPMLEARVCLHKDSVWDPENLYVALPFITDQSAETYVDKTGCILRPGIDQLPGTCQNFYLIQNGLVRTGRDTDVIISTKDAPLISFGKREAAPIRLCDGKNTELNRSTPYSWIMNNFWETNFKADLGGFYEFTYTVITGKQESPRQAMEYCKAVNEGILGFYI
ncbi:glycoside hydrolase family 38 N-terminal domain-containing protein [Anaerocolumna xylanovorans]|uniref:Glycosyl hydrolases family 38 N-terminal domain-containing protein n=1 Tax=Anaerocolumna xylanovorans DSM 12503 TaxID=1121345 RepID=A0A1M7YKC3_9FIRM|nr:hypothetical protein [Anaerocolumna xylanovorans]SHO53081.1 Glycosyl hydrolases family 38 N-terminal domain-containing protein [Anaerocolumna xylanovorans DSM 12503]